MRYLILAFFLLIQTAYADPLKIMFIGESTFLGYYDGAEHEEASIPLLIKRHMEEAGVPVDIENRAAISTSARWHLENSFLAESRFDVVVVQLGINDVVRTWSCQFYADFSQLIDACKKAGKRVYISMPNKISGALNFKLEYYTFLMAKIGIEKQVQVINWGTQETVLNDKYHPTQEGYESLSEDIIDRLLNDIENKI